MEFFQRIYKDLAQRKQDHSFRSLKTVGENWVDFSSNDYLGFALNSPKIEEQHQHGSGGSRLLAGNYPLIEELETYLAEVHHAPSGLIYNSGYVANLGVFSCLPQKGDTVLYDQLIHASIKEGIRSSFAQGFSFKHNDLAHLEQKIKIARGNVFIAVESVYSMDGDCAPLKELSDLAKAYHAYLIVDEAHALGVNGKLGLVQKLGIEDSITVRVLTFGKALGCHGALVLCNAAIKDYLINFSRPFIYSTALPPQSCAVIQKNYERLLNGAAHEKLLFNIQYLNQKLKLQNESAIFIWHCPSIEECIQLAKKLQEQNLDVRAILPPTVPKGKQRLRICLHAFNTPKQMDLLAGILVG